ncbi:type II secretion system ATPase GspE [Yersinia enterocolitica]|uniref:type II secretion system ATPase GspE n=1 Tax=Yersinia enterocolitica TaxID=630 RepID=UPI003CC79FA6
MPVVLCRPSVTAQVLQELRRVLRQPFRLNHLTAETFEQQLTRRYQRNSSEARQLMEDIGNEMDFYTLVEELPNQDDLLDTEDDAPIIRLINAMLAEAIKLEASDIHIETYETQLAIRFRVDGVLRDILQPQRKLAALLVSRIKVMAKLDIAEKRVPQDGRISLRIGGRAVDVRVSTMPSSYGERVVLRLLDKNTVRLELQQLGISIAGRNALSELIHKPHGIILVTGPTGSGKSTTLYAALSEINTRERNILTVEDPIEYDLAGTGQMQVNPKVGMTFARGLRAILRQDPDVVMVGEIRDTETAQIAVQASLTGHLVLSTLHTNTASGAITRLRDMGIEPFLLSTSLLAVLAQRLVRVLCPSCKTPYHLSCNEQRKYDFPTDNQQLYQPVGCELCNFSGYKGRTGIYELVLVNEAVRAAIHSEAAEQDIERLVRLSTPGIRQDGLNKVLLGETSLEEVLRVTRED